MGGVGLSLVFLVEQVEVNLELTSLIIIPIQATNNKDASATNARQGGQPVDNNNASAM